MRASRTGGVALLPVALAFGFAVGLLCVAGATVWVAPVDHQPLPWLQPATLLAGIGACVLAPVLLTAGLLRRPPARPAAPIPARQSAAAVDASTARAVRDAVSADAAAPAPRFLHAA